MKVKPQENLAIIRIGEREVDYLVPIKQRALDCGGLNPDAGIRDGVVVLDNCSRICLSCIALISKFLFLGVCVVDVTGSIDFRCLVDCSVVRRLIASTSISSAVS